MVDPYWMDFSGAPPLVVPHRCLPSWHGFFVPSEPDEEDDEPFGDLVLPNGRVFDVWDECDFDNPATDYDRVCAHTQKLENQPLSLYPVEPTEVLTITDYGDSAVGWWAEQRMILTVSRHVPDLSQIPDDGWTDAIEWDVPEGPLRLLHSCEFGTAPAKDHYVDFEFEPGRYRIDCFDYAIDFCVMLYRFRRVV